MLPQLIVHQAKNSYSRKKERELTEDKTEDKQESAAGFMNSSLGDYVLGRSLWNS